MKRMQVRILCGGYVPSSAFVEGGCGFEWLEVLEEQRPIRCPGCGVVCKADFVQCAVDMFRGLSAFNPDCGLDGVSRMCLVEDR